MIAQACTHKHRAKDGKDRKGNQRWKCRDCRTTFASDEPRPLGNMRTDIDKAVLVLNLLLEGMSIRAVERITGMKDATICDLILVVGENCDKFLESTVVNIATKHAQLDELWDFVDCKSATKVRLGRTDECGDVWTWVAIDAHSKLILSHTVGQRGEGDCIRFLRRLNKATVGRIQVTSDGHGTYTHNVPFELGSRVDFAQLIKTYSASQVETRYSPAVISGIEIVPRFGSPDLDEVSTSYVERVNLSFRMHVRRYTRLTNAHSKTFRHHAAMTAIFVCWYNFCRKHETLRKATPAMASGLADHVWTLEEMLTAVATSL